MATQVKVDASTLSSMKTEIKYHRWILGILSSAAVLVSLWTYTTALSMKDEVVFTRISVLESVNGIGSAINDLDRRLHQRNDEMVAAINGLRERLNR